MPLIVADQLETRVQWALWIHQVNLTKPRHHADLKQQPADAGMPGLANTVQPHEWAAGLWRRQGFGPGHVDVEQRLEQLRTRLWAGQRATEIQGGAAGCRGFAGQRHGTVANQRLTGLGRSARRMAPGGQAQDILFGRGARQGLAASRGGAGGVQQQHGGIEQQVNQRQFTRGRVAAVQTGQVLLQAADHHQEPAGQHGRAAYQRQ